jgi:two-component system chemotaxis sensor kinase CheA
VPPEAIVRARESLALLSKAVAEAVDSAKKIMGDDFGGEHDILLRIPLSKLKEESAAISSFLAREPIGPSAAERLQSAISDRLRSFRFLPARKGLAKAIRIVPGLSTRMQKNVKFDFKGAEVLIDCETAHELNTPLVHLLRNAFGHGIEKSAPERTALGKPPEGRVTVSVSTSEASLLVAVADDGRGIDTEALKRIAIRKGMLAPAEAARMSREDLFALVYLPGLTTAEEISEVSGRGVGMDAVRRSVVDKLGGEVSIASEQGKGTVITIKVPVCPSTS